MKSELLPQLIDRAIDECIQASGWASDDDTRRVMLHFFGDGDGRLFSSSINLDALARTFDYLFMLLEDMHDDLPRGE